MIRKEENFRLQERPNIRGGEGTIHCYHMVEAEESYGKCTLCSLMVIEPGCSIGDHPHDPDAEIYYMLEGELQGEDNGVPCVLRQGDVMYTGNRETHNVRNATDKPVRMLAIVLK